jgi:tetratricopeptide (TPR) repeat protein
MAVLTPVSGELIDRLASQPTHRAMVTFLGRHRALWDPAVVERLYERVVRVARIDLRQADRLADATAWLAAHLADDGCRAQSLRATGHVLLIRGQYREAIAQYDAALKLFRALGREVDVGRTLSGGALQSRILLGQYDDAFASGEEARLIFERHGERLHLARLDSNMGNILYRQDRFQDALPLYERAYAQLARIGQPPDVAAVLSNLAVCYTAVNDFGRSLAAYHHAREYCEANGLPLLVAQADYNIAYLHYLRGEYTRALELYRAADEQSERVGDAYHQALCDLDRSEIYLELNMSGEAGSLASRALASFDDLGMAYEAAKAMTNLAIALSHGRQTAPALDLFDRARALFTGEGNQAMLALVDFYRALVLYRDGRYGEARPLCRRALRLFAGAAMAGKAVRCELLLARLELDAGDLAAAEQIGRSALHRANGAQSPILRYQAYVVLGLIREAAGDPQAAYEAFERARTDLEYLRGHLRVEDLKVAFLKDKVGVYEGLVSTCLAIGTSSERQERAFGFIEEAKSRGLADLIFFRGSALAPRVESDLGDEVRDLREQVDRAHRHIELEEVRPGTRPARRLDTLRQRARVLEGRLGTALTALRAADQEFAAIDGGVAFALDEIRSVLTPGTTLLEYYEARGLIYACVLDRERLAVVPVASAAAVRDLHGLLQFQISKFRLGAAYAEVFADRLRAPTEAHLRELYDALVAPIRDRLRGDHLVVVPHGFLHYVPFHALFDGARFLIDQFTVSYAPSASVYRLCCMDREPARGEPLVMGVTDPRTPYITDEIEAVANALPGARVFMGEEATADRLRSGGSASPLVHIATHGIFRGDNPLFSSIRLGDGPLRVFDLYHLRLSADLVALSGCSTGLNAVVGADELLGLVRGLLYAGARALLLTLWDVHDLSTANFMRAFYGHLRSGKNKAQALQLAMQEIRAQYPHPFYWAPFVLIGHVQQK